MSTNQIRAGSLLGLTAAAVFAIVVSSHHATSHRSQVRLAAARTPHATASQAQSASSAVSEALNGAESTLQAAANGGYTLAIKLPAAPAFPGAAVFSNLPAPTANAATLPAAQTSWLAQLAGGYAAAADSQIVGVKIVTPAGASDATAPYLSFSLRAKPGQPMYDAAAVGEISLANLQAQLNSNLSELASVLPAGVLKSSDVQVVSVDPAAGVYGLEADLEVSDLAALAPYTGDVVDGLATGLMGGPDDLIEGLAINVADSGGHRASWWSSASAGIGMGIVDPELGGGFSLIQGDYSNLTGGPATSQSVSGGTSSAAK